MEKWDSTSVSDSSALHTYSCCPWLPVLHCDIYLKWHTLGVIKLSSAAACKFAYNSGRSYQVFIHAQPPLHTAAEGRDTLSELLSPPDLPFLILPVAPLAITPSFSSVGSHCFPPPSLPPHPRSECQFVRWRQREMGAVSSPAWRSAVSLQRQLVLCV